MKVIPLGLQCSVPEALKYSKLREYSYPFDWLWTPSKTTFHILEILINKGIEEAIEYMTNEYTYYKYLGNEHYESVNEKTECQMNKGTGLGITHFEINEEYKTKLRTRFERLLVDIKSSHRILFIYADAADSYFNYYLDDIEYGLEATEYLIKIYDLIYPINQNIEIIYFCWHGRRRQDTVKIKYCSFDFQDHWMEVSKIIDHYLRMRLYSVFY
jgi:hypothetical protein